MIRVVCTLRKEQTHVICSETLHEIQQALRREKWSDFSEWRRKKSMQTNQRLVYDHVIFTHGYYTGVLCNECLRFQLVQHQLQKLPVDAYLGPVHSHSLHQHMGCFDSVPLIRYY